ncbi:MAG TPA: DUF5989 family protein [Terriglobales bacterium]|jgi:hypothetical protein|nr:DUF5989 family protein [Terriglobales bacterium]
MGVIASTKSKLQTAGELFGFFGKRRWWILPIVITVVLLGVLLIVGEATSLAPFIYTMF